jgi:acid phosphatase (class A)
VAILKTSEKDAFLLKRKTGFSLALLSLCLPLAHAWAQTSYLSHETVDISQVLPAPPQAGSVEQAIDLQAVISAQARRTPAQEKSALAENDLTVFQFNSVLGPSFNADKLPATANLFKRIQEDSIDVLGPAKDNWKRPRPFLTSDQVRPVGSKPGSASYPSGNSLLGYVYAVVLAQILPAQRDAIFAKGLDIGNARVVAGVHYPTDVAAGRLAAVDIVANLGRSEAYLKDLKSASEELQAAYPR